MLTPQKANQAKDLAEVNDRGPAPSTDPTHLDGGAFTPGQRLTALDSMRSSGLVFLQRSAGNRAVSALLAPRPAPSAPTVARAVNPTTTVRHDVTALLGDGGAFKRGLKLEEFQGYILQQADWFTEPSLNGADRTALWRMANLLAEGPEIAAALGELRLPKLIAASAADMVSIRGYAAGAVDAANTVRITRPDASIARVIQLGQAMLDLAAFVPGPVLRVCINQTGLETLVDEGLVATLRQYYTDFSPTIENPDELEPLLVLLRGGIAPFAALADWVHDLHVFTPPTRVRLVANVADKSRRLPVLLVLMSGLDWNAAFLQASNLESAVKNPKNLALVIQGAKSLPDETVRMNKTADDYGQIPKAGAKARLGQVVIAGHGQSTMVEQTTPGTGATTSDDKTVSYTETPLHPTAPGDDSEKLIDAILSRLDPADARVVFAGCLVGSHDIPETAALANPKTAAAAINASLAADPNLRDLVVKRMAALTIKGKVEAANASTTFGAFNLDSAGKARLSLVWDPDVGGPKAKYVKTGAEPEGALRAALETWADPKLGPTWTTKAMRKHVTKQATTKEWWQSLTRTAFKLALPASGDVDPALIANLAHRVEAWLLAGWPESAGVDRIVSNVKPLEAPTLYPVMLASDHATPSFPHLPIVVQQAWMNVDPAHEAPFMAALGATPIKRVELSAHISAAVVDPRLPTLLTAADPKKPTKAQLLLALTIAVDRPGAMPAAVQTLLSGAAGGARTTTFPAALNVPDLLDGAGELEVLRSIGLAPGAPSKGGVALPDDANVDLDLNKINETFVKVAPRPAKIVGAAKEVLVKPDMKSKAIGSLAVGTTIQVVGRTGAFTVVDFKGKIGFVNGVLP